MIEFVIPFITTVLLLAVFTSSIFQCFKNRQPPASASAAAVQEPLLLPTEGPPRNAIEVKTDSPEQKHPLPPTQSPSAAISPSAPMASPRRPRIDPSDVGASTINQKKQAKLRLGKTKSPMSPTSGKKRRTDSAPRRAPDYQKPEKPKVASFRTRCHQEDEVLKRELKAIPAEVVTPCSKLNPPENAKKHVKKMYQSGEAAKIMEAEVVAFSQADIIVRLELFSRIVHYVDTLLIAHGVDFTTRPPKVPLDALEWATADGMPGVITARAQMLAAFSEFNGHVGSNFDLLPPDGTLLTVYKHAMREDLDVVIRIELMNELLIRTREHVLSHWENIKIMSHPLPMLGRVRRRNPDLWLSPNEYESTEIR
uniref:Tyrosine-protein phosphatase domain-containing protein n=1 Tax=Panagrellus redivivus TaxID=6233 RepID=A0A7E4VW68_PANRE